MLRDAVQVSALGGEEAVSKVCLGPIPMPDVNAPPSVAQLLTQVGARLAEHCKACC